MASIASVAAKKQFTGMVPRIYLPKISTTFFCSYLNAAEYYSMLKLNEVVDYSHLKDVDLPPCMVAITYEDTMIYFQKQLSRVIKKNIQRKKNRSQSMVRED